MSARTTRAPAARRTTTLLLLTALGGSAGCNQISGANDIEFTRAPDYESGSSSSSSSSSSSGGGSDSYDLSCGDGNVAVGIHGRSGEWIDKLGLICAPLQADGTLGSTFMTSAVGGNGGGAGQASCPMNEAMVGIEIWSKVERIYRINLLCQAIAEWKMPGADTHDIPGFGKINAQRAELVCDQGSVLNDVAGESSQFVLRAQFHCTKT